MIEAAETGKVVRSGAVRLRQLATACIIAGVRVYQLALSPLLGPACRFHPTCSAYTIEAVRVHGPLPGLALGVRRIARCHPLSPGGIDPVP